MATMEHNTQDLSKFGYIELREAARLLTAYCDGSQDHDFLEDGIAIEFNPNSGSVFLVDEEFNVGMMNGDKLEQWLNCSECGNEGFLEDMKEYAEDSECCKQYLIDAGFIEEDDEAD